MVLSSDMIQEFAKITNDDKQTPSEATFYGTIVEYNGDLYVQIDGSDQYTPINTTTNIQKGERVVVRIKDHTATVTGNLSSPSARNEDVEIAKQELKDDYGQKIEEFDIILADKVSTEELSAQTGRIDDLVSDNVLIKEKLTANEADIDDLTAKNVKITEKLTANEAEIGKLKTDKVDTVILEANYAKIDDLEATTIKTNNLESAYGEFVQLTTKNFESVNAEIKNLDAEKLTAEQANLKYANIDFSNIEMAAVKELFTKSGIIKDLVVGDQHITGELVGVTIKGNLIEGETVIADKLVIKGEDGIYYKLNTEGGVTPDEEITEEKLQNGLHGDVLIKKSITAEKINVHDLVAFGATIGGFHITDSSIYSGVKESVLNTTRGIYMDDDGQMALGDESRYIRYYKDAEGNWKIELSANSIKFGTADEDLEEEIDIIRDAANDAISNLSSISAQQEIDGDAILSISNQLANLIVGENGDSVFKEVLPDGTVRYNFANMQSNIEAAVADINGLKDSDESASVKIKELNNIIEKHSKTLSYIDQGTIKEGADAGLPFIELGIRKDDSGNNINAKFKVRITNKSIQFMEENTPVAWIDNEELHIRKSEIVSEQKVGGFVWTIRQNGNMGLMWKGVSS